MTTYLVSDRADAFTSRQLNVHTIYVHCGELHWGFVGDYFKNTENHMLHFGVVWFAEFGFALNTDRLRIIDVCQTANLRQHGADDGRRNADWSLMTKSWLNWSFRPNRFQSSLRMRLKVYRVAIIVTCIVLLRAAAAAQAPQLQVVTSR